MPLISIIISYFNSHVYVHDLLQSIDEQTIKDCEIIVIDDKSDESSLRKLKELIATYAHLSINLIVNPSNVGVAKSRNRAFDIAKGEFITFIDADDMLCGKYSLEYRVRFLQQHTAFSGIGGYDYRIDEKNAILLNLPDRKTDFFRKAVSDPENLRYIYAQNVVQNPTKSASALFFATGSCLFRRADIVDFPFDPIYETEDDIEWLLRFLAKKKIALDMVPFHCRRIHPEQYHLRTPKQTTEKVKELCRQIVNMKSSSSTTIQSSHS